MRKIEVIAATVTSLASPGMKPKELIAAVRTQHPDANKKDIVRAAFYAAIEQAETDPHRADTLHDFASSERNGDDTPEEIETPKKNAKRKS